MEIQAIENGQGVITAGYLLLGGGIFLLARMLVQEQESREAQENLDELKNRKASNPIVQVTRPYFTQYVVPLIRGKPFWDEQRVKFRRKLISGGLRDELTPDEFIAFKLFNILFFPLVLGAAKALQAIDLSLPVILLSGVGGWFYPDLWVNSRVGSRQKAVLRSMPFVIDLLALSTEAGLDFMGAIQKVVEKAKPSPLIDELSQLLRETKIGVSRKEALREMAARIDLTEFSSFTAILISAEEMGASIGKILRQQSDQIRTERMLKAEKAGAAAAQKIILPIVFCIVPAVFIMVIGPFALSFLSGK